MYFVDSQTRPISNPVHKRRKKVDQNTDTQTK